MVIPFEGITIQPPGAGNVYLLKELAPNLGQVWFYYAPVNVMKVMVKSPVELRVFDSHGRLTGVVNGQVKKEIPSSTYYEDTVIILSPPELYKPDSYKYEVKGMAEGAYGLEVISTAEGATKSFVATKVPTSVTTLQQYTVNWEALSQGEKGVTMSVDADGDGTFEEIGYLGEETGGFPWVPAIVGTISGIIGVLVGAFLIRRHTSRRNEGRTG
jgi:hypothetical protein